MTGPPARSPRLPGLGLAALLLALLGGGILGWRMLRRPSGPVRVLLVEPDTPVEGSDVLPSGDPQARAVVALLAEELEYAGGCAVARSPDRPVDASWRRVEREGWVVKLDARREGDRLRLLTERARGSALAAGGSWQLADSGPLPPAEASRWLLATLGLPARGQTKSTFLPEAPSVFWDLVQVQSLQQQSRDLERATLLAESCEARAPRAAAPHVLLGMVHLRRLALEKQPWHREHAMQHLQAALRLQPGLPRAVYMYVRQRTDTGGARESLDMVLAARRQHPHSLTLLTALAYTARYAGLLELAERASLKQNELLLHPSRSFRHLHPLRYTGRWEAYRRSLWTAPGDLANPSTLFFRGFLDLLEEKPADALAAFRTGEGTPGNADYQRMSRAYRLILEGRVDAAKQTLEELRAHRLGITSPDGEMTLEMAQGFALAGDAPRAMELAQQAFIEGFGCTDWFKRSPFLEPVRHSPRWRSLIQKLEERQNLVETAFPPATWGL